VITFESVTKRFADGTTAVHDLDLEISKGEVTILVGPSGCGKTTTLRMINRMIEATSGRIVVDGRDVRQVDPPELRRGIGYVIQQVGLFPHRTIAQNIATVPELSGWDKRRTEARVAELLTLVGLPAEVLDRYPHQLSGGQRQRVGVARALAVDPPIMLMDEPFGAVDPIVRSRLQDEFLRLQQEVRKTIVFVTHDIDEAIKMGDRIAILQQGGVLAQYAPPDELLARPASDFVVEFLGAERGLKRLALIPVSAVKAEPGPTVSPDDEGERARAVAEAFGSDWVVVVGDQRKLLGWAHVGEALERGRVGQATLRPFLLQVRAEDSLRAALNAMVQSHTGVAVRVSDGDRYEGLVTQDLLTREIT
jgi:osmoprotectant transport system ATP-binding protein